MNDKTRQKVDRIIGRMTLEQKVGGCFMMDFEGTVAGPYTREMIERFHIAGLRVETGCRGKVSYIRDASDTRALLYRERTDRAPRGHIRDFKHHAAPKVSPAGYARTLNALRKCSMERPLGIPVHFTMDQEGNGTENLALGDIRCFPPAMGLTATDDLDLVERVAEANAMQLRAVGINWLHSPVLDVNTDPENPEIGVRAYSNDPDRVAEYACATMRGYRKHNIVTTGKHFPGRGESKEDAHDVCPLVDLPLDELMETHVKPYRALIEAGIPAIMIAHSVYPALDDSGLPATISKRIVTGLLREELGFDGVITTDNLFMRGMVERYGLAESCILSLLAGQDLLLFRNDDAMCEEVFNEVLEAARSGRLPEERLDEANRRILGVKHEYGLFDGDALVDPERAAAPQQDKIVLRTEIEAAEKATQLRNTADLIPLAPDTKVLLVEMIHTTHLNLNNENCHPQIFWELLQEFGPNIYGVELKKNDEQARARIMRRLPEADVLILTVWKGHRAGRRTDDLIDFLKETGKPLVIVTDSPYLAQGITRDHDTVVNVFSGNPESLRVAGKIIFGRAEAMGVSPIRA